MPFELAYNHHIPYFLTSNGRETQKGGPISIRNHNVPNLKKNLDAKYQNEYYYQMYQSHHISHFRWAIPEAVKLELIRNYSQAHFLPFTPVFQMLRSYSFLRNRGL